MVSVPNVHWTDGALVDLAAVAARTRDVGARLVIDGSQSIGAMPLDVGELRPDFVVSVGYKWLLGPFSVGYLYVAEEHRQGEPLEENWILRAGSEDFARLVDYRDEYQPGARRFDVGERTKFELTPMAIAALEQLLRVAGPPCRRHAGRGDRRHRPPRARTRARPAAAATSAGRTCSACGSRTTSAGAYCPRSPRRGCYAAVRGGSLRISPHLHTTAADVERLLAALAASRPWSTGVSAAVPERIVSPDAPDPLGPYAHAVRAAGLVFCSGQGARDPATGREAGITLDEQGQVTAYDIRVQTEAALRNLAGVLDSAGVGWERLIELTVYLKDMDDFAAMNEVYAQHFPRGGPARTTVGVADLPADNFVEIRAIGLA